MSGLPPRTAAATAVLPLAGSVGGCSDDPSDPEAPRPSASPTDVVPSAAESPTSTTAVRNRNNARKGATFEVRMGPDGKRYSLLAFRVA